MSAISVSIATERFLRVAAFLKEKGSTRDPVDVIGDAVDYWLDNADWKLADLLPDARIEEVSRGYVWKIQRTRDHASSSLFLPSGSALRIRVGGRFEYAIVDGDALIFRGAAVSPNQFARRATGTERDAWRDVWVKRPGDSDYQHADALRQERLAARARAASPT